MDDICDFVLFLTFSTWIFLYFYWGAIYPPVDDLYGIDWSLRKNRFIFYLSSLDYRGDFDMFVFLAVMVVFMWGRLLVMLQLNRLFGPMLRIIISMIGEVLKFLLIWMVVLICQTSVASLIFGELEEYSTFVKVFFIMFETGLGAFERDAFSNF